MPSLRIQEAAGLQSEIQSAERLSLRSARHLGQTQQAAEQPAK